MEKIVDMTDALKQVREYKKEPEQEKMVITNANKAYQSYKAGDKEHYKAADDLEEQKRQLEEEIKCLSEERDSMIQEKRQEGFAVRYSLDGKRLVQAYKTEKDAEHRAKILKSMGGVKDVSITKHILNFKEEVLDEFTNFKSITFKPKGKYVSDGKYEIVYDHGRKALVTKKQLNVWLKQKFIEIDEELKEGGDERFSQILRIKRAIEIAKKMAGNYTGATKEIEKIAKGLSKEKDVEIALMKANEEKESKQKPYVSSSGGQYNVLDGDGKTVYTTSNKQLAHAWFKKNYDKLKEVKEQDEKKPEEIKANAEKDAEKKLQAQTDDEKKDVKEDEEKDKEELKANADAEKAKELKAQEIKDKMKTVDVKEDVKALVGNESDLSDEFKNKASTIFEAAVRNKLADEVIRLEDEYADKVKTDTETAKNEIVEKVDGYLNYIVEEWMKENELAVEQGLKSEVAEDFISGLKKLFESHYIDIPEEKYNVIEDQAAKIDELNKKLNESIEKNVELNQENAKHTRDEILSDVASDLADTEKDKFNGLAENVEYNSASDFRKKVETLKASYFPKSKSIGDEVNDVAGTQDNIDSDITESMAAYTAAISKQKKLDIYNKK